MTLVREDSVAAEIPGLRRLAIRRKQRTEPDEGGNPVSTLEMRTPSVRIGLRVVQAIFLIGLVVAGLGPLLWLAKASVSSTQDIIQRPLSFGFSDGVQWGNLTEAWDRAQVAGYLSNTFVMAFGSAIVTLIVCLSTAYVLSVLRPRWAGVLEAMIMVTLFVPSVIALVPLYLTVRNVPLLNISLLGNYPAVWLPAGANAFLILVVKRFFDALPRELFEAARIDGAGPVRILVSLVMPLSGPIIGVVALLSLVASWKDFLWPLLVLTPERAPISVGLQTIARNTPLNIQIAALLLALIVPVLLFLIFQRQFLRGAGMAGGIKG